MTHFIWLYKTTALNSHTKDLISTFALVRLFSLTTCPGSCCWRRKRTETTRKRRRTRVRFFFFFFSLSAPSCDLLRPIVREPPRRETTAGKSGEDHAKQQPSISGHSSSCFSSVFVFKFRPAASRNTTFKVPGSYLKWAAIICTFFLFIKKTTIWYLCIYKCHKNRY